MNWKKVKLGEITTIVRGSSPRPKGDSRYYGGKVPRLMIEDMTRDGMYVTPSVDFLTEEGAKLSRPMEKGDLVVTVSGRTGVAAILNVNACIHDGIVGLKKLSKNASTEYLYYFFKFNSLEIASKSVGAIFKNLTTDQIKNLEIPLPDLATQKHIAEVLDKADALRQQNRQLLAHYDELLQSTFIELFGDPVKNPKGWEVKKLGEVCRKITDGTHKTPNYQSEGVTFISAKNIKNGEIDWSDLKFLTKEEHLQLYKRCNPEYGDVLITKSGSIGMAAIVKERFEFSLFESLALVKLDNSLTNYFFRELINSNNLVHKFIKGVGVKHLHLTDIRNLPIPVPPLPLQQHFAKIVEQIEAQKAQAQAALAESEALFEGLLAGYFK